MARALPVFRLLRLAIVMPRRLLRSVRRIFRRASMTSRLMTIGTALDRQLVVLAQRLCLGKETLEERGQGKEEQERDLAGEPKKER